MTSAGIRGKTAVCMVLILVMTLPAMSSAFQPAPRRDAVRIPAPNPAQVKKPIQFFQTGPQPTAVQYDPASHTTYVMNHNSSYVTVLGRKGQLVAYIRTGFEPSGAAYDPRNRMMYIANQGNSTITVVDARRNVPLGTIPSGVANPVAIAFDPANGQLFVASTTASDVAMIDPSSGGVLHIPIAMPVGMAYGLLNKVMFIVGGPSAGAPPGPPGGPGPSDSVTEIGPAGNVVGTLTVGHGAKGAAVDSSGNLFVTNHDDSTVSIGSPSGGTVHNVPVPQGPWGIVFDPKDNYVYFSSVSNGSISALNANWNVSITVFPSLGGEGGSAGVVMGNGAFNPSSSSVIFPIMNKNLVAFIKIAALTPYFEGGPGNSYPGYNYANHEVLISDNLGIFHQIVAWTSKTHKHVATITLGSGESPGAMAYSPNTGFMYVVDTTTGGSDTGYVIAIDSNNNVVDKISVGDFLWPVGIAYNADDGNMYVTVTKITGFHNQGYVDVIDGNDNIIKTITVGTNVKGITYDSQDQMMYLANGGDGTVSEISDNCLCVTYTFAAFNPTFYSVAMAYDPFSDTVYAAHYDSSTVVSIYSSAVSTDIAIGHQPTFIASNGADGYLWVAAGHYIVLIDGGTDTVKATLTDVDITFPQQYCGSLADTYNPAEKSMWITNPVGCDNFVVYTS